MKHIPKRTFKSFLLFGLLLWAISFSGVVSAQGLDEDNGFMGLELGSERDSLLTTMVQKRGKFQKLMRWDLKEEHLNFDGIDLQFVRLFYWDNQLHSIEVKAMGEMGNLLRTWIMAMYGEGEKKDAMGFSYQWYGDKVLLLFDQNLVTKDLKLTFRSRDVHKQYYKFRYVQKYGN